MLDTVIESHEKYAHHYGVAIATGLAKEAAKIFACFMVKEELSSLHHLRELK